MFQLGLVHPHHPPSHLPPERASQLLSIRSDDPSGAEQSVLCFCPRAATSQKTINKKDALDQRLSPEGPREALAEAAVS